MTDEYLDARRAHRRETAFVHIVFAASIILAGLLFGCATPTQKPMCDRGKVVVNWSEWDAEVRSILCREAKMCGEPDENVGYGFTVALFHDGLTPCLAAERIIEAARK